MLVAQWLLLERWKIFPSAAATEKYTDLAQHQSSAAPGLHQWGTHKSLTPLLKMAISPYFSTGRLSVAQALKGGYLIAARGFSNFISSLLCLNCNLYSKIMIKFLKTYYLTLLILC